MVSRAEIQAYADKIAARFHPEKIILFGSYAYGTPNEDSDVDLLVIMEHDLRNWQKSTEIRSQVGYSGFAMDLLVRTPKYVHRALTGRDYFMQEVIENGTTLYARGHVTVGA